MASPYPAPDPQNRFVEFQQHIEEMVDEGYTNPQIVAAPRRLGFKTSIRSLQRFLKSWGLRRPSGAIGARIGGVSDELAEAVNYLFHYTTLNDT
jgi:hypothetical protein